MLFLPAGSDIYIFSTGGKMIQDGYFPYKDFIDSKPPGIFYLYAGIHSILGSELLSIRIFDCLYHIISLTFFFFLLKRYTGDIRTASLSILIYALWYVSTGIWSSAQSESFALLPVLVIIWSVERCMNSANVKRAMLYGLCAGLVTIVLISLKFTLLYPAIIAIAILLWHHPSKKIAFSYSLCVILTTALSLGYFYYWLHETGGYEHFLWMTDWLKGYSSLNEFSDHRTFSITFFEGFPERLLTYYSPTFVFLGTVGIYRVLTENTFKTEKQHSNTLYTHLLVQCIVGIATILFERKNIPYHFIRSFWAFAPFVALGLIATWDQARLSWIRLSKSDLFTRLTKKIIYTAIILLLLFGMPIVKIYSEAFSFMLFHVTGYSSESLNYYEQIGAESQMDELASYMKADMTIGDNYFAWGTTIGLYSRLKITPPTIMLTNLHLRSVWTSDTLKATVLHQLRASPPRYITVESNDHYPHLTGSIFDSYGAYLVWSEFLEFVDDNYSREYELPNFTLFKRL